jgi:hypothetical protein
MITDLHKAMAVAAARGAFLPPNPFTTNGNEMSNVSSNRLVAALQLHHAAVVAATARVASVSQQSTADWKHENNNLSPNKITSDDDVKPSKIVKRNPYSIEELLRKEPMKRPVRPPPLVMSPSGQPVVLVQCSGTTVQSNNNTAFPCSYAPSPSG